MIKNFFTLLFLTFISINYVIAQKAPKPAHIVVVIYENQAYQAIIGSSSAPYINSLAKDSNGALFTNMYANSTAASQPNYFFLFAGSDMGVTSNKIPTNTPFTACNLGASLITAGYSFKEYSEGLPSVGWLGTSSGNYDRKHNPCSDWQGTLSGNIPSSCNQPFSSFPGNYDSLPTVSFVVPNEVNNMHNTFSGNIQQADNWLKNNIGNYITWAKTHNSLLIFTFDEDDGNHGNHVPAIFVGPMVKGGSYSDNLSHLNVLHTLEDIYGLPSCGNSGSAALISNIWNTSSGIEDNSPSVKDIMLFPVPATDQLNVNMNLLVADNAVITISDLAGRKIIEEKHKLISGENKFSISMYGIKPGFYFFNVQGNGINLFKKVSVQ